MSEECWGIIEERPIPVDVIRNYLGYYIITGDDLTLRYETFEHLDMNHIHSEIKVSASSYDYHTGEFRFIAEDKEAIEKWLKKYKDIVVKRGKK